MAIAELPIPLRIDFVTIDPACLDAGDDDFLDALPFGVIGLSRTGNAEIYNQPLTRFSGLKREHVLGQPFFLMAGVCMNNYLVSQRFDEEESIDSVIDYTLTFRMRVTPVKLRLLKRADLRHNYLLIRH